MRRYATRYISVACWCKAYVESHFSSCQNQLINVDCVNSGRVRQRARVIPVKFQLKSVTPCRFCFHSVLTDSCDSHHAHCFCFVFLTFSSSSSSSSSFTPPCSAARSLDVDKCIRQKSGSPELRGAHSSVYSGRDFSPEYYSADAKRSRYPRQDSAAPHTQVKNTEHYSMAEGGRSRHADTHPEPLPASRPRHGDKYPVYENAHAPRGKNYGGADSDEVVRKKKKPDRPPPPQILIERDKTLDRERTRHDRDGQRELEWQRDLGKDSRRGREQHLKLQRDPEKSREGGHSGDRQGERDRRRQKQQVRGRSRDRELEEDLLEPEESKDWLMESSASWEDEDVGRERRDKNQPRVYSISNKPVNPFRNGEDQANSQESWEPGHGGVHGRERSYSAPNTETGTTLSSPSSSAGLTFLCEVSAWSSVVGSSSVASFRRVFRFQICARENGTSTPLLWGQDEQGFEPFCPLLTVKQNTQKHNPSKSN